MITYVKGDATVPQCDGPRHAVIAHIVNNQGGWGKGFVTSVSRRWPEPEAHYRLWTGSPTFQLGVCQFVQVTETITVANMLAQDGYSRPGKAAISYPALTRCLRELSLYCGDGHSDGIGADVHMPRIGTGLAGGEWGYIELIIGTTLVGAGIKVKVYDL